MCQLLKDKQNNSYTSNDNRKHKISHSYTSNLIFEMAISTDDICTQMIKLHLSENNRAVSHASAIFKLWGLDLYKIQRQLTEKQKKNVCMNINITI